MRSKVVGSVPWKTRRGARLVRRDASEQRPSSGAEVSRTYLEFPPPVYVQRGLNLLLERGDLEPLPRQVAVQVEDLLAQVADVVDALDEQRLLGPEPRHLELEQPDVVQPLVVVLLAAVQRRVQNLRNEQRRVSPYPDYRRERKSAADRKKFDQRGCFRADGI